ncbi:hypothetical protein BDZ94DRAFT_1268696 [Collybia nuda]|uniref:Uncharacterized protein n=1 Tax=Collybia nuda TaxID=64659 RepID=A0A9P5XWX2_9AGAR|nr:hypothetical protein BDZ94DRAFT_1268696 [Collybia nuda]
MFYLRASIAKIPRWFARCQPSAIEGAGTGTGMGLTLHIRCTPEPWFRQARQQIAETLVLPHAPRLRSLTLLSTAVYAPYLTGPPAGIFPSLEVLHLADHEASVADARDVDAMTVFGELPKLRVYRHSSRLAGGHVSSMPVFIPWGQLEVLDLGGTWISLHTCWDVLFQCKRLMECTLQAVSCRCAPPRACTYLETHVVFPDLRHFEVTIHGPDDCTVLLGGMTAPKLEEFSYTADVWSHTAFMGLSNRSRLPYVLRTVSISGECTGGEAYEILQCHPRLVKAVFLKGAVFGGREMEEIGRGEVGKHVGVLYCGAEETGAAVSMLIARSMLGVEVAGERGRDRKSGGDWESGKDEKRGGVARLSRGAIRVPEVPTTNQLVELKRVQDAKPGEGWFALHVESRAPVF